MRLLLISNLWLACSAFAPVRQPCHASSLTQLHMIFDWLNPNKTSQDKETTDATKEHHSKPSTQPKSGWDWIVDSMNQVSTTSSTASSSTTEDSVEPTPTEDQQSQDSDDSPVAVSTSTHHSDTALPASQLETPSLKEIAETVTHVEPAQEPPTMAEHESSSLPSSDVPTVTEDPPLVHHGRVQWFNPKKGYGFITALYSERNKADKQEPVPIFVHQSAIEAPDDSYFRTLLPKETVDYQVVEDDQGRLRAIHVRGPNGEYVKSIRKQILPKEPQNEQL